MYQIIFKTCKKKLVKTRKLCQKTCGQCRFVPEGFCGDDMYRKDCEFIKEHNFCQLNPYSRDSCRKTCGVCGQKTKFPIEQDDSSTWSWAHDGTNENGIVELLADGTVTWKGGEKEGYWKLNEEKTVLEIYMGLVHHKLEYDGDQGKAILISPVRSPFTTMKLITSD